MPFALNYRNTISTNASGVMNPFFLSYSTLKLCVCVTVRDVENYEAQREYRTIHTFFTDSLRLVSKRVHLLSKILELCLLLDSVFISISFKNCKL